MAATNHYSETIVNAWAEFVAIVDGHKGTHAFRGMSDARWRLQSSLERYIPEGNERLSAELALLIQSQKRAHDYIHAGKEPRTNREWLALMQHFGAPTRLLDFTRSPYVAALFAFENLGTHDRAVWAVDLPRCYSRAGHNPCLLPGLLFLTRPWLRPRPSLRPAPGMLEGLRQSLVSSSDMGAAVTSC